MHSDSLWDCSKCIGRRIATTCPATASYSIKETNDRESLIPDYFYGLRKCRFIQDATLTLDQICRQHSSRLYFDLLCEKYPYTGIVGLHTRAGIVDFARKTRS
jgi:hypothetical protein